jgi:hypothetical protein
MKEWGSQFKLVSPCGGHTEIIAATVLLLYEEPNADFSIPADAPERKNEPANRRNWNAAMFTNKYGLKLVGANYFVVVGEDVRGEADVLEWLR